jgi:XTP/dITP diphosphohydrolase
MSKRFEGAETSFSEKMDVILQRMRNVPEGGRGARFNCWVAVARPGVQTVLFNATCEGRIARVPSGTGGFGYDPIFWLPLLERTMADLTAEEKHQVSHRGKVLRAFGDWLESGSAQPPAAAPP